MTQLDATSALPSDAAHFGYPASAMVGDYLRAAVGLAPTLFILATVSLGDGATAVLGGFAAIFAAIAIRTALRHGTSLEMDEIGLRTSGWRRTFIVWAELDRVKLAYYSTRRDRKSGWMQLQLGAGRARLSLDSRLDGFEQVARQAADAASERGLAVSDATAANLQALGIRAR